MSSLMSLIPRTLEIAFTGVFCTNPALSLSLWYLLHSGYVNWGLMFGLMEGQA